MITTKKIPDVCKTCGAILTKKIVRLAEGEKHAFLFLEECPVNIAHYSHYRPPEISELSGG